MLEAPPRWPLVRRAGLWCNVGRPPSLPWRRAKAMDLGVAEFLNALCAELIAEGTSSRDLVAIEFDPDSDNVDVLTGMEPHLRSYPDLISILKAIGQTCSQDRIDAQQLRRISFLKEEIKLELVSRYGHQRIIYSYPIEE
jgi:hypothetical protein